MSETARREEPSARSGRRALFVALPLAIFAGLAVVFLWKLEAGGNPSEIPSVMIGKSAPDFQLPPLDGLAVQDKAVPGFATADLKGQVTLVNFWASWCIPCRQEHPFLTELSRDKRIRLVGMNYKDKSPEALKFLTTFGNPYSAVAVDAAGRTAIDFGVYGVPETFLVGRDGRVLFKFFGPITPEGLEQKLRPEIEKALAAPA